MIALNPRVLILDEANTMLDGASKKEMNTLLEEIKKEGTTIVSFTHDGEELLFADQIIVLDKGSIVFNGNKNELYSFDSQKYGVELPMIMKLEKELGYPEFNEDISSLKVGDIL
jgi:energy-coupling factor transport system ATP-binding protein